MGVTTKLDIRRELTRKMQLKLGECEQMWRKRNDTLIVDMERLTASNKQMLKLQAAGGVSEAEADLAQVLKS